MPALVRLSKSKLFVFLLSVFFGAILDREAPYIYSFTSHHITHYLYTTPYTLHCLHYTVHTIHTLHTLHTIHIIHPIHTTIRYTTLHCTTLHIHTIHYTTLIHRCSRVVIGGASVPRGRKTSAFANFACNNLRCLQCNFKVR